MDASRRKDSNDTIGLVLIILGGVALLSNIGLLAGLSHVFGALLFGVLGALAWRQYRRSGRTGVLVGAFALFGLAAASLAGALSGFFFLALVGVGFGAVYWLDRERWWAIIPAGTMLSLAVVAALAEVAPRYESGAVLFIGLAATFGLLYRLPDDPKPWAIYPAVAMLALAVLGLSIGGAWLLPLALVGVGVYLLYRRGNGGHSGRHSGQHSGHAVSVEVRAAPAAEAPSEPKAPTEAPGAADATTPDATDPNDTGAS